MTRDEEPSTCPNRSITGNPQLEFIWGFLRTIWRLAPLFLKIRLLTEEVRLKRELRFRLKTWWEALKMLLCGPFFHGNSILTMGKWDRKRKKLRVKMKHDMFATSFTTKWEWTFRIGAPKTQPWSSKHRTANHSEIYPSLFSVLLYYCKFRLPIRDTPIIGPHQGWSSEVIDRPEMEVPKSTWIPKLRTPRSKPETKSRPKRKRNRTILSFDSPMGGLMIPPILLWGKFFLELDQLNSAKIDGNLDSIGLKVDTWDPHKAVMTPVMNHSINTKRP